MVRNIKTYGYTLLSLFALTAAIASCSTDENLAEIADNEDSSRIHCTATDKIFDGGMSRSSLSFNASRGMVFSWEEGDEMTVMAKGDFKARQIYSLITITGEGTKPDADFATTNFKMQTDKLYYAFSKAEKGNGHVRISDQNNITVDYSGQTQIGNGSAEHLGDYDFMASAAMPQTQNSAHFPFKHLGATVRFIIGFDLTNTTLIPSEEERKALSETPGTGLERVHFTEMEIYDSDNSFRQNSRWFSFEPGTEGNTYTLKWPEQKITSMDRFKLTFRNKTGDDDPNNPIGVTRFDTYEDKNTSQKNHELVAYMELPPADLRNKDFCVMLRGYYKKNGEKIEVSYVNKIVGFNIEAGKAYQKTFTMEKPKDFKVTLKLNHMWQHGSTLDQSRASTGDPGYDKKIFTPKYIYYIYCQDEKVIKPQTDATGYVTTISGLTSTNWDTKNNDGVWTSTYKGVITLQKPKDDSKYHLYVVASESDLESSFSSITSTSTEDNVKALVYSIPNEGDKQVFMRDLYSTPWDADDFSGNITDPIQDVTLYHVAAKVDLKWNSSTDINTISVNNVKNEGLYLFKPTENALATGTYTATKAFGNDEMEQWYNGRYVFYLPQFTSTCSYNVSLNSDSQNIEFKPVSTTGGFTSWLRWLKKQ